jgi:Methyltransferase domain.
MVTLKAFPKMYHPVRYVLMRIVRRLLPSWVSYNFVYDRDYTVKRFKRQFELYNTMLVHFEQKIDKKIVLEIGSGSCNPSALAFLLFGARKIILLEPFIDKKDQSLLRKHALMLFNSIKDAPVQRSFEEVFAGKEINSDLVNIACRSAYDTGLPDCSLDISISHVVLEYMKDIKKVFREQFRIVRPGGCILHIVDLRDHYFKYPFEMLTFSKFFWENVLTRLKRGEGYQNRLRIDDYIKIIQDTGFSNPQWYSLSSNIINYQKIKSRLHADFANREDEMMAVETVVMFARKPGG